MKSYTKIVEDICQHEEELDIFSYCAFNVPIWQVVKYRYRNKFVTKEIGISPATVKSSRSISNVLKNYFISWFQFTKFFFQRGTIDNLFYGFPRLEKINGHYFDKFVEPLILETSLKDSYLYLEFGKSFIHHTNRSIKNILWFDFIALTSKVFGFALLPFVLLFKYNRFYSLYKKGFDVFFYSKKDFLYIVLEFSRFLTKAIFIYFILKRFRIKRFFAPTMGIEFIIPCKWNRTISYELQHGITTGITTTYCGKKDPDSIPDYFLSFGESSMYDYFSVPIDKMFNIGYAFKNTLKSIEIEKLSPKVFLVLSDPEITEGIVSTLEAFSKRYKDFSFHLRLHPLEELTIDQQERLQKCNIVVADNSVNSSIAVMQYHAVIGVNTTVLYEAVSLGVKAACIVFNGLNPEDYPNPPKEDYFYYLRKIEDLNYFYTTYSLTTTIENHFFSDFKKEEFYKILELQ